MVYSKVNISWEPDTGYWNEICAWVVEEFGVPGHLYTWHPGPKNMEFRFQNETDAIKMLLRWSEACT